MKEVDYDVKIELEEINELPIVYNTCGWEREEILRILDGIIDIYLPDFKYSDGQKAAKYSSGADTYVDVAQSALLEMHRQVGDLILNTQGIEFWLDHRS